MRANQQHTVCCSMLCSCVGFECALGVWRESRLGEIETCESKGRVNGSFIEVLGIVLLWGNIKQPVTLHGAEMYPNQCVYVSINVSPTLSL